MRKRRKMIQKRRKFFIIIGVFLAVMGLIFLFEGQLKISTKNFLELTKMIEDCYDVSIVNTKGEDNVYIIYGSANNKKEDYIFEVIKNPITKKFSISDIHIKSSDSDAFGSVIESGFYVFAFDVDLNTGEIQIYERSLSNKLYISLDMIFIGIVIIYYNVKRIRRKK